MPLCSGAWNLLIVTFSLAEASQVTGNPDRAILHTNLLPIEEAEAPKRQCVGAGIAQWLEHRTRD